MAGHCSGCAIVDALVSTTERARRMCNVTQRAPRIQPCFAVMAPCPCVQSRFAFAFLNLCRLPDAPRLLSTVHWYREKKNKPDVVSQCMTFVPFSAICARRRRSGPSTFLLLHDLASSARMFLGEALRRQGQVHYRGLGGAEHGQHPAVIQ